MPPSQTHEVMTVQDTVRAMQLARDHTSTELAQMMEKKRAEFTKVKASGNVPRIWQCVTDFNVLKLAYQSKA